MSWEPLIEYGQAIGSRRHPGVTMSLRKQGPGMLRLSPGEPRGISCRVLACAKKGGLPYVRIVGRAAGLEKAQAYRGNLKWVVPADHSALVVCLPFEIAGGPRCQRKAV
jgi:hypothetical protein